MTETDILNAQKGRIRGDRNSHLNVQNGEQIIVTKIGTLAGARGDGGSGDDVTKIDTLMCEKKAG